MKRKKYSEKQPTHQYVTSYSYELNEDGTVKNVYIASDVDVTKAHIINNTNDYTIAGDTVIGRFEDEQWKIYRDSIYIPTEEELREANDVDLNSNRKGVIKVK